MDTIDFFILGYFRSICELAYSWSFYHLHKPVHLFLFIKDAGFFVLYFADVSTFLDASITTCLFVMHMIFCFGFEQVFRTFSRKLEHLRTSLFFSFFAQLNISNPSFSAINFHFFFRLSFFFFFSKFLTDK